MDKIPIDSGRNTQRWMTDRVDTLRVTAEVFVILRVSVLKIAFIAFSWVAIPAQIFADPPNPLSLLIGSKEGEICLHWEALPTLGRSNTPLPDIPDSYRIETSRDLISWHTISIFEPGGASSTSQPVSISFTRSFPTLQPQGFFRVVRHLDLSALLLDGANFHHANFAGATLAFASLSHANLAGADLRSANLAYANLSHADLTGALTNNASLRQVLLLDTIMPDGRISTDDPDAEDLALELSGQLLAPVPLYLQIHSELAAIRSAYTNIAQIHHGLPWVLGKVGVQGDLADINTAITVLGLGPATIQNNFFGRYSVQFTKHYNPEVLTRIFSGGNFGSVEPDFSFGDGDNITLDPVSGRYTFTLGSGDCLAGCIEHLNWVFEVSSAGEVTLVSSPH